MELRGTQGSADTAFHVRKFLDGIRSRAKCNGDILTGHLSTSATLRARIALQTRNFLEWDTRGECFTNNPDLMHSRRRA